MISLLYAILAVLCLTFLIFIHELGHYWMARRVGMRVDTFSIGFGRPIYQWERDGVKWQIGWLLCGGYVKIAGMDTDEKTDPYSIKDGFFGNTPFNRIKVLFMGPFVNILFALIAFALLWGIGGRSKNFAEYTHKIGWVDQQSELFQDGVRPGDEVVSYGVHPFQSAADHLYAPMTSGDHITVNGLKDKTPFSYTVKTYPHPDAIDKGILTSGILQPASYVIYNRTPGGKENPLPEGSPLIGSGIEYGDSIVWVDGEMIYSSKQLHAVVNSERSLLTVKRDGKTILRRVPRVQTGELKLSPEFKEELIDWQFEGHLNRIRLPALITIPYIVDDFNYVDGRAKFIEGEVEDKVFPKTLFTGLDEPLQPGDQIVAVEGSPVKYPYQMLSLLQEKRLNIIVDRDPQAIQQISWEQSDQNYDQNLNRKDIQAIADSIGTDHPVEKAGHFYLLKPITPKNRSSFALSPEKQAQLNADIAEQKKQIESIEDPERRTRELQALDKQEKQLLIGLPGIQDRKVNYNPNPFVQFNDVFQQIWRMMTALFTGSISPKWMSGPVGIVQAVQEQSRTSLKEMLFWLGAISLNLGVINLFPVPPFDGGGIVMALSELVTGRRLKAKTMERLVYPFAVILIVFFLFITYHDLTRIFGRFLKW